MWVILCHQSFSVHKNGKTKLLVNLSPFFALVTRKPENKSLP